MTSKMSQTIIERKERQPRATFPVRKVADADSIIDNTPWTLHSTMQQGIVSGL